MPRHPRPRPPATVLAAAFAAQVHASAAEIALLARFMVGARDYLEFGSGGSTRMALAAGIERLTAIETDGAFRDRLARLEEIAPSIASGRLRLIHADIGPTENWGYPLAPPPPEAIEALLSWPERAGPVDLVFIDGRYRVAAAAASWLASPDAVLLIHDYASRPHYHAIEHIARLEDSAEEMSAFRFNGDKEEARKLLAAFRDDIR